MIDKADVVVIGSGSLGARAMAKAKATRLCAMALGMPVWRARVSPRPEPWMPLLKESWAR